MLKKTVTYVDYNGNTRTEDFWFNFSEAQILEMELSTSGGLTEVAKKATAAQDFSTLVQIFKDLVLKAYGEKSADGKRFIKSEELSTAFSQTEAYSKIFMELAMDDKAAADFINGLGFVPAQKGS